MGEDGDTVVIGDGFVVDAEEAPVGLDIHQDTSKVVCLSKLEAEGPIYWVILAKETGELADTNLERGW